MFDWLWGWMRGSKTRNKYQWVEVGQLGIYSVKVNYKSRTLIVVAANLILDKIVFNSVEELVMYTWKKETSDIVIDAILKVQERGYLPKEDN